MVGHLQKGKSGRFAKTVFYFLRASENNSCNVTVNSKAINCGDGDEMLLDGSSLHTSFHRKETFR